MTNENEEVLNKLTAFLNKTGRGLRVDFTTGFPAAEAYKLFEAIAVQEVAFQTKFVVEEQRKDAHLFFCENERYGALAAKDDFNFIVLNLGTVPTFYSFFLRLMAIQQYWPKIGNVKKEIFDVSQMQMITLPAWKSWAALPSVTPEDPTRIAFAIVFATHCSEFIVRHELGHILLNHCEYKRGHKLDAFIDDTQNTETEMQEAEVSQAFELCADNFAAVLGYEKLLHGKKLFGKFPEPVDGAIRAFHASEQDAIEHYLLSLFFAFRLFDQSNYVWTKDFLCSRSHPPAAFRFHSVCIHLQHHLGGYGRTKEVEIVEKTLKHVWEVGEEMFAAALGRQPNLSYKEMILGDVAEQHFERLNECLSKLPQNLTTISYIKMG